MSGDREVIAHAVGSSSFRCSPYFNQLPKVGTGHVRLDRVTRASNGFGFMTTWQVVAWLPPSQAPAEKWIEKNLADLLSALGRVGVVTAAVPVQMQIDNHPPAAALVVELVRETEE